MKITKFGHACLLIEVNGVRLLTDPGNWNEEPTTEGVSAVLITHEHQDHCDLDQLRAVLARNPNARVITHEAVATILRDAGINAEVIEHAETKDVGGISVQSCGTEHAAIYKTSPCRNTGFLINGELFVPGDALHDVPEGTVRLLALPTGGPWMKMAEAIEYAKKIKPEVAFPIHDAMYTDVYRTGLVPRVVGGILDQDGIRLVTFEAGETKDI